MIKPYSESCDQNREPILKVLLPLFSSVSAVLEIGSGTGQHAIYFADKMPHLTWYTSDCKPYLEGINMWLSDAALPNVAAPIELNVSASSWPSINVDAVFTANSLHIMHQRDVVNFIKGAGRLLAREGNLVIYGPFNYQGNYTCESNARFDQWLKARDPESGVKHFEDVESLADESGMKLAQDYEMPANNRILHFIKV
jgi:cyclopropane fatty-acyl-phospholipid synthase-like methyltransferase